MINIDIHSLVTRNLYPEQTQGMSLEEIKRNLPDLRKKVKAGVYAYSADGDASHLVQNGLSKEEAEKIFNNCTKFLR